MAFLTNLSSYFVFIIYARRRDKKTSSFVLILCKKKQIVIVLPNRLIHSLTVYYKRSILSGIRHILTAFGSMSPTAHMVHSFSKLKAR
jgi:hypothetical protein